MCTWIDDVRQWPFLHVQGIQEYFLNHQGCDEQPNGNYRSLIEGQNYLRSGWVGKIEHQFPDTDQISMRGPVRYSQSINNYHAVQVTLSRQNADIVEVKCDCMANQGKCCSHTAGLLYKVNEAAIKGYTGVACTDKSCAWNSSTSQNVLPDTVENICAPKNAAMKSMFVPTTALETDADVISHFTTGHMVFLAAIPGTIMNHVLTAKATEPKNVQDHDLLPKTHGNCADRQCELCETVFTKHVKCDTRQRVNLARATRNQGCGLWLDQRKIRITSSETSNVPKKTDPKNWIDRKLNNRFMGNEATRHGQECEPLARNFYERTFRKKVKTTGLVVHPNDHWLGASLDGIIDNDTILEIKCPTLKKLEAHGGSLVRMIEANKYDVRLVNGKYKLRQTASGLGYYYQVQIAMHCAQKKLCKFLVWTPDEHVVADVEYDPEWVEQRVDHLRTIYFGHLLPAISTRISYGHWKVKGL